MTENPGQMEMFPEADALTAIVRTFAFCQSGHHERCVARFPGCGWNGYKSVPAPDHVCNCNCHKGK